MSKFCSFDPWIQKLEQGYAQVVLDQSAEAPKPLSPREIEVLEMISRGFTNPQIADRLNVSVHAVKFHLASVYRKLGVANRTEAAVALLRSKGPRD
jgi:DNA-binding NarL/FixJ family response regulator